ncbi:MAG: hypothetical protein R3C08_10980 [Hyphomonas sp.]
MRRSEKGIRHNWPSMRSTGEVTGGENDRTSKVALHSAADAMLVENAGDHVHGGPVQHGRMVPPADKDNRAWRLWHQPHGFRGLIK